MKLFLNADTEWSVPVREVEPAGSPDAPSQPGSTLPGSDRKRTIWLAVSRVVGVLLCGAFWLGGAFRQPTHKAPIHSVAVMPFIKLSGEGQDYIADAVTDSLIANLAQIHSLQIFARTATIRYRKSSKSITRLPANWRPTLSWRARSKRWEAGFMLLHTWCEAQPGWRSGREITNLICTKFSTGKEQGRSLPAYRRK